ncbi:MAG: hypothetical protein KAJ92_04020, partial [Gammaproteobacteria bacterium]|nr:hypothetical protein [Gammaproteobacteria bacterium]
LLYSTIGSGGSSAFVTLVADANGVNARVTHIQINSKEIFIAAGASSPGFNLTFRTRLYKDQTVIKKISHTQTKFHYN